MVERVQLSVVNIQPRIEYKHRINGKYSHRHATLSNMKSSIPILVKSILIHADYVKMV